MLGQIERPGDIVVADFEAGLGTVSRLKPDQVDLLIAVAEPTAKAIDVAQRGLAMIGARGLGRSALIGNHVAADGDLIALQQAFPDTPVAIVPEDDAVRDAGLRAASPFDWAPDSPAVRAVRAYAATLVR